jgi:hypothetical protein
VDAAGSASLTWLQVAGCLLALAVVIAGAVWFWSRYQERRADDADIARPPTPKPPRPPTAQPPPGVPPQGP